MKNKDTLYERQLIGPAWGIIIFLLAAGVVMWAGGCLVYLNQEVMLSVAIASVAFIMTLTGVEGILGQWSETALEELTRKQLWRGFGLVLISGIISLLVAVPALFLPQYDGTPLWMLAGSILVTICSAICMLSYKKQ